MKLMFTSWMVSITLLVMMGCSTRTTVQPESVSKTNTPAPVSTSTNEHKKETFVEKKTIDSEPAITVISVPKAALSIDEKIALRMLGDSLYEKGAFDEALPVWVKILEHADDKPTAAAAHYVLGTLFYQRQEYFKAELEFKRAIESDSTLIDVYRELGFVYFVKGDYDKARASFETMLTYLPGDSEAVHWVDYTIGTQAYEEGLKLFTDESYDKAIEKFQSAISYLEEDTSANYKIHYFIGKSLLEKLDYDNALKHLSKAVSLRPEMHEGYTEIGAIFFARSDYPKAIGFFQRALTYQPTSSKALNNLGYVYFTLGNQTLAGGDKSRSDEFYKTAVTYFEQALVADPAMAGARYNLDHVRKILSGARKATAYTLLQAALKTENQAERIRTYYKAIEQDPTYDDAYVNLGVAMFYHGQADSGIIMTQKAIEINAYNAQAHNNLGYMLGTAHRWDESLKHIFLAIQIKRDYTDAYVNLGYVYMWKEDFESSRKVWLQLLKNNPDNTMARKGLVEMERREKMVRAGESTTHIEIHEDRSGGGTN